MLVGWVERARLASAKAACARMVICHEVWMHLAHANPRSDDAAPKTKGKIGSPKMTDFFVHGNCFLREPVGVPNPVGDDREE